MKPGIIGAAAALALSSQAMAQQQIDPLVLPQTGVERNYACASYLNAFSAMIKARDPSDKAGTTLKLLFLVMAVEARADANDIGQSSQASDQRMNDWDDAVVDATLTSLETNADQFQGNLITCMKMATDAAERGPRPALQTP